MKVSSPYVNKLFGLSTSLDVHKNSIRVGWRYDAESDFFELTPYIYEGGIRTINATKRLYVKAGQEITIELSKTDESISLRCITPGKTEFTVSLRRKYTWMPVFLTHPFWGGYDPAPVNMSFFVEGYETNNITRQIVSIFGESPTLTSIIIFIILASIVIALSFINVLFVFISLGLFFFFMLNDIFKFPIYQWLSKLFRRGHSNY